MISSMRPKVKSAIYAHRLLARANSVLLKDQPEQQRDLRFAAQLLLQQISRDGFPPDGPWINFRQQT